MIAVPMNPDVVRYESIGYVVEKPCRYRTIKAFDKEYNIVTEVNERRLVGLPEFTSAIKSIVVKSAPRHKAQ